MFPSSSVEERTSSKERISSLDDIDQVNTINLGLHIFSMIDVSLDSCTGCAEKVGLTC